MKYTKQQIKEINDFKGCIKTLQKYMDESYNDLAKELKVAGDDEERLFDYIFNDFGEIE